MIKDPAAGRHRQGHGAGAHPEPGRRAPGGGR